MAEGSRPLEGRVALLTGAVRRSGRDAALRLAADGARVVINTRSSRDLAEGVVRDIEAAGGTAMVHLADITREEEVDAMVAAAVRAYGRLDILVNNAADRGHGAITEMSFDEWRAITSIILDGSFLCSRAAVPHMIEKGWGRLVFLGGIGPYLGYPQRAHVATGKAGLVGLMHCLAIELADKGITANVVSPGRIGGERAASAGKPTGAVPPVGYAGDPADVGRAVHFLCLPESRFITGQTIHVNGGGYLT